jgi:hypothetical protein
MTKQRSPKASIPSGFEKARDEMYSHILRCGVLEAQQEHQKDWFDDTMEYLSERYPELTESDLTKLRKLGERYCQPVIQHGPVGVTR